MISAAELAAMQATVGSALDLPITVQRATRTSDGAGHFSETYATVAVVQGNLTQPTAGQLQNYDYLIGALSAWQVRVPQFTNVQEADQVLVGGLTLKVQVLLRPHSYETAWVLLATEIQ
jgi:hypothetical protein